jgi:hypothetical protein
MCLFSGSCVRLAVGFVYLAEVLRADSECIARCGCSFASAHATRLRVSMTVSSSDPGWRNAMLVW